MPSIDGDMQNKVDKATILIEALPYIRKLRGQTIVIKYGGNAMVNEDLKQSVMEDITLLKYIGINPILSGILTMTGLYTVNFMMLGGQSNLYLQRMELNSAGVESQVASETLYKTFRGLMVSLTGNRKFDANLSALIVTAVIVGQMFFRHRGNILRLVKGEERKTYIFKKGEHKR